MFNMSQRYKPSFTNSVVLVCTLIFLANFFLPTQLMIHLYSRFAIIPVSFFDTDGYLTLLTYQFLHLNFQHLLSNMFVLYSIGKAIESEIGSTKFSITYLVSGIFSGLLHVIFNPNSEIMVIGASGAIFGAIALLLLLMPFKFTTALIIPMPGVVLGLSMLLIEVASIRYSTDPWVAHDIHLYGFLVGGLASFGIDYDKAVRGLIISVIVLMSLYYWAFYIEGMRI